MFNEKMILVLLLFSMNAALTYVIARAVFNSRPFTGMRAYRGFPLFPRVGDVIWNIAEGASYKFSRNREWKRVRYSEAPRHLREINPECVTRMGTTALVKGYPEDSNLVTPAPSAQPST